MKRIVCLILSLVLVLSAISALADAALYSSEPEKLFRQLSRGSGLKGSFTLNASGESEWTKLLSSMNGVEMQLRMMDSGKNSFHYRLYVDQYDEMAALTEITSDGTTAVISSDFLMGQLYSMPAPNGLFSALMDVGEDNVSWLSLAMNVAMVRETDWVNKWAPTLTPLENALERWLTPYLVTSVQTRNGDTAVFSSWSIPAEDVKAELVEAISWLMGNQTLLGLLQQNASSDQAALYLQPAYLTYYQQVVDALPLTGTMTLERTLNTRGDTVSYLLDLPMAGPDGLKELTIRSAEDETEVSLFYADRNVVFTVSNDEEGEYTGVLRVIPDEGTCFSVRYEMNTSVAASVDSKSRNHEDYDVTLTMEPDLSHVDLKDARRADYITFEPATVHITVGFYSKPGDQNVVTCNLAVDYSSGTDSLNVNAQLKSASPWHVPELTGEAASDLTALTDAQRSELLQDWFANGLLVLRLLQPADSATQTDLTAEEAAE